MKQQAAVKNVKLEPVVTAGKLVLPTVNDGFLIKSIHVDTAGETRFDWLQPMALQYENQRYDVKNLDALVKYLYNQLVDNGYVTSTVVVPEQDLSSGLLKLQAVPGYIGHIRFADLKQYPCYRRNDTGTAGQLAGV